MAFSFWHFHTSDRYYFTLPQQIQLKFLLDSEKDLYINTVNSWYVHRKKKGKKIPSSDFHHAVVQITACLFICQTVVRAEGLTGAVRFCHR